MSTDQEFDNGCILYGLRELPPQQVLDRKELENHTTDAQAGPSADTPADKLNEFQVELDRQLLQEEEQRIQQQSILDLLSSDIQPGKEVFKGDGDQSGEKGRSEGVGDNSAAIEGATLQPFQVPRVVLPPGSRSQGVTFHKNNKQWEAHLWIKEIILRGRKKKGVQIFAGNYRTEDEAKQAHDRVAIKFDVRKTARGKPYPLNFPESEQAVFMAEHSDWTARDFLWKLRRSSLNFSRGKSGMKGVTVRIPVRKRPNPSEQTVSALRYAVKISQGEGGDKRTENIGTFGCEEEAGKAYDRALLYINRNKEEVELWHVITNFRPSTYTADEVLEAGSKLKFK